MCIFISVSFFGEFGYGTIFHYNVWKKKTKFLRFFQKIYSFYYFGNFIKIAFLRKYYINKGKNIQNPSEYKKRSREDILRKKKKIQKLKNRLTATALYNFISSSSSSKKEKIG